MKTLKRLTVILTTCSLAFSSQTIANAAPFDPASIKPLSVNSADANVPVGKPKTQYPIEGGTWQYGHWATAFRSNYTVNRCHGSTVQALGRTSRTADTRAGITSAATIVGAEFLAGTSDQYWYRVC